MPTELFCTQQCLHLYLHFLVSCAQMMNILIMKYSTTAILFLLKSTSSMIPDSASIKIATIKLEVKTFRQSHDFQFKIN